MKYPTEVSVYRVIILTVVKCLLVQIKYFFVSLKNYLVKISFTFGRATGSAVVKKRQNVHWKELTLLFLWFRFSIT